MKGNSRPPIVVGYFQGLMKVDFADMIFSIPYPKPTFQLLPYYPEFAKSYFFM